MEKVYFSVASKFTENKQRFIRYFPQCYAIITTEVMSESVMDRVKKHVKCKMHLKSMNFMSRHDIPLFSSPKQWSPSIVSLLKVNEVFFQYSDGGRRKGLPMAPLSPRDVTSCHMELFTFSRQCSEHC